MEINSLVIHLPPQTDVGRSVASLLVDRQTRCLSAHTVDFYASELRYLQACPARRGSGSVQDKAADLLQQYLCWRRLSNSVSNVSSVSASTSCWLAAGIPQPAMPLTNR